MKERYTSSEKNRKSIKGDRGLSFLILAVIYLAAGLGGAWIADQIDAPLLISIFAADVAATVFTFIFSLILKNASVYDPYWSVAPIAIVIYLIRRYPVNAATLLMCAAVIGWGVRLTANWAYTFPNLNGQDWRYTMLHEKTGKFYPFINFTGIHMVPTLVVFLCMRPVILAFTEGAHCTMGTVFFFCCAVGSFIMQGIADLQMHRFRKRKTGGIIQEGLWSVSRHPNYLGEILMWWSVGLMCLFSMTHGIDLLLGALVNTCLFLFVSIPMAENRQLSRSPEYALYRKETNKLIPLPSFRKK